MKRLRKLAVLAMTALFVSAFSGGQVSCISTASAQDSYQNPAWAPPYSPGVRYYYLPDIETYYDLSTQEFVYLYDGQWCFSLNLPPMYADFDLNDCFSIALNVNVFQPWMHHHYYVSNYPRYYYRDYYDHNNIPYVRGFNENMKKAIFYAPNERSRARSWDGSAQVTDRQFRYSKEDLQQRQNAQNNNANFDHSSGNNNVRQQQQNANTRQQQPQQNVNVKPSRAPQSTNYYGKNIGQPVKVQPQMRAQNQGGNNGRRK